MWPTPSLLDEATAAAEAMTMAERVAKSKARAFFVDRFCHPQTIAVIRTRAAAAGDRDHRGRARNLDPSKVFGAIFQYPGSYGHVRDFTAEIASAACGGGGRGGGDRPSGAVPAEGTGRDGGGYRHRLVAALSACRWAMAGPHAAFMAAVKDAHKRQMPGRIVGVSIDARGNKAYRLSLQTREQHIRREKATSNVCTAQALLAVMASFYAVFHGPKGLRAIAERVHFLTQRLAGR
jgi:glycine dehydrogenase